MASAGPRDQEGVLFPADVPIHADMAEERQQLLVAAEVAVQPALDVVARRILPGGSLAAQDVALLDQLDRDPRIDQLDRGGQAGQPATYNQCFWHICYI